MTDILSNTPEITPHNEEVNPSPDQNAEHQPTPEAFHPHEVQMPVDEEQNAPAATEERIENPAPQPQPETQEPTQEVAETPVVDTHVRDEKAETDLFSHNSELDPREALENLLNQ